MELYAKIVKGKVLNMPIWTTVTESAIQNRNRRSNMIYKKVVQKNWRVTTALQIN